ncbi:hypothetical protein AG1IA_03791 [Rhizoctonia solani AG-1 IA]|uniref:Uncharacterized protein n=1 Tax=Thanatephorus cucumeris (strain AG1-IA) TaxID=983506 RepID=L8X0N1_THACA|nr:hypothetical protein AG1IA_03791 [Rhizoctonia solani AG-1 IA]
MGLLCGLGRAEAGAFDRRGRSGVGGVTDGKAGSPFGVWDMAPNKLVAPADSIATPSATSLDHTASQYPGSRPTKPLASSPTTGRSAVGGSMLSSLATSIAVTGPDDLLPSDGLFVASPGV